MHKLTENNIIDTLKNFTESPSERCWESIANNLPAATPQIPNNTSLPQSGFSHFFSSIAGKILLAVASIATIATIITLVNNNTTVENIENSNSENIKIISDTNNVVYNSQKPEINKSEKLPETENNSTPNQIIEIDNSTNQNVQIVEKEIIKPISITSIATNNHTKTTVKPNEPELETVENNDINNESSDNSEIINSNIKTEEIISTEFSSFDLLKRPNVFTPNGDGYNDFLVFENIELFPKNRLIIINSNGVKVLEQNQYNNSWDGINVPDGTYFYILEVNNGQKTISMYGSVQVLR